MRVLFAIIGAGAAAGYAVVYFALGGAAVPEPQDEQPAASAPQPAAPVVLPHVVDVTDVDPLLDPSPTQPVGVPFDPTEPLEPPTRVNATPPAGAPEVAPMPREVGVRSPLDARRVAWYGDQVLHRQLYDWLNRPRDLSIAGVGYFF